MLILDYPTLQATFADVSERTMRNAIVQAIWHQLRSDIVPERWLIVKELPDRKEANASVGMARDCVDNITSCLVVRYLVHSIGEDALALVTDVINASPIKLGVLGVK
jgi:hypothetical protein